MDSNDWMSRAVHADPIVPAEVDTTKASIARTYDYHLGGKDNFAADRAAGDAIIAAIPDVTTVARANRAFLRRCVRFLVTEAGIDQIVDLGSGLPTMGNVHEVAHEIAPETRVVYVDNDPIVLAHGRALLADNDATTVITADLREPEEIFNHPDTRRLIDPEQPFAILMACILHHFHDDEDPEGMAAAMRDRLPSGGYLLVSNACDTGEPYAREAERSFIEGGLGTGRFRTPAEQSRYFDGLEMVEPGLVTANTWRPDTDVMEDTPGQGLLIGGIGHKP